MFYTDNLVDSFFGSENNYDNLTHASGIKDL